MSETSEFQIGEKVMVPMRGMCKIVKIEEETILGQTLTFVHLKPSRAKGLIKVPSTQLEGQGVRALVGKDELLKVLDSEPEVEDLSDEDAGDRMPRWMGMLRNADYATRLQVLRELMLLDKQSLLNAQEKRFKKQVRLTARREIESALETSAAGAGRKLNLAVGSE